MIQKLKELQNNNTFWKSKIQVHYYTWTIKTYLQGTKLITYLLIPFTAKLLFLKPSWISPFKRYLYIYEIHICHLNFNLRVSNNEFNNKTMLKTILFIKNKHRIIDYVFNWKNNAHSVLNVVETKFLNLSLLSLHIVLNMLTVREVCDKSWYTKH